MAIFIALQVPLYVTTMLNCAHTSCFQMALECVVEETILMDRCLYLLENGCDAVYKVPLFDEALSPRCFALVAIKSNSDV
jgi:hypothetical protein